MLSLLFYIFVFVYCGIFMVISLIALIVCYPFDPARKVVHNLTRVMNRTFFWIVPRWTHEIKGVENIDPTKRYVVVMNHQNMMDIPALYYLNFNYRWVSKKEVFWTPIFGQFLALHGDIAIERGNPKRAMRKVVKDGVSWINRGASIVIFPEGTRSRTGEINRFKAGAFNLAKEADVEILPVVMDGTRTMIKPNWLFNWTNKITLHVLPSISRERVATEDSKELMEQVRQSMIEELNNIRK